MNDYDEDGSFKYSNITLEHEPETYSVAISHGSINGDDAQEGELWNVSAERNQIIGVVSAQLRRRSPLIASSSNEVALPSVPLPSPHVWVANMRVDDKMQRKGVGMALLSSVRDDAKHWISEKIPLVLSVDYDNVGARSLYEKVGFEYLERNNVFCIMIFWP
jgi:GNAT superfamily N-acetyltransferase